MRRRSLLATLGTGAALAGLGAAGVPAGTGGPDDTPDDGDRRGGSGPGNGSDGGPGPGPDPGPECPALDVDRVVCGDDVEAPVSVVPRSRSGGRHTVADGDGVGFVFHNRSADPFVGDQWVVARRATDRWRVVDRGPFGVTVVGGAEHRVTLVSHRSSAAAGDRTRLPLDLDPGRHALALTGRLARDDGVEPAYAAASPFRVVAPTTAADTADE